jgi:hypothetical protein
LDVFYRPDREKIAEVHSMTKSLTPLKAIRARCIDCSGFERKEVKNCQHLDCPLYHLRTGKGARATLKKIRSYCLWCCNDRGEEVRLCPSVKCPLWAYRLGKRRARPQECPILPEILTTGHVLKAVEI